MRDVIGYEEKDQATMAAITSGYPRFVTHFYIRRIAEEWARRFNLQDRQIFVTSSETAAREALLMGEDPAGGVIEAEGLLGVHVPSDSPAVARIKAYLQHIGGGISSRLAERYLMDRGLLSTPQHEDLADADSAEEEVVREVADLFGAPTENVLLSGSGMNAFHAIFRAINVHQEKRGRTDWVQLGWLYVDTIEILRKLSGGEHHFLTDVLDLDRLERLLEERGGRIAGIVTEAPTNPLIQTPDLQRLRDLAARYEIPLVVDPTLASPYNIDVLPLCDVAINSLTKYAASHGDVMAGAAVLNPASPWTPELRETVRSWLIPPFIGDVRRLALEMRDYRPVMKTISANTTALTAFLEGHPSVARVYGPYSGDSGKNYTRLQRRPDAPGGVLSIKLHQPLAEFYDRVELAKGPSFGTTFTLLCPFLYLAHYNLVSNKEGRRYLSQHDLDPELLRISVGTEDLNQLISAFKEAL